jgi:hypothetical protein
MQCSFWFSIMATTKASKVSASILSVALLFCIVGVVLLVGDLLDYKQGVDSRKWLPIEGKIKTQSIRLLNRDGGANHFALNASYIYHIGERAYRGYRVAYPNELLFTASQPEKSSKDNPTKGTFARYAPEASITVYYNPNANEQSTLTKGARARRYLPDWLRDIALIALAAILVIWRQKLSKGKS